MASRRIREIDVVIEALDADGLGTATYEDRAVRVRNALPGESVHARVLKRRRGTWYAQADSPECGSTDRQMPPPCAFFPRCGGCALQHLAYDAQLKHKESRLLRALEQTGVRPQQVRLPVTGPRLHYRYKARLGSRLVGNQLLVGFRESFSSRVTRMDDCKTLALPFARSLPQLQEALSDLEQPHLVPQVELAAGDTEFAYIVRHLQPLTDADRSRLLSFAWESGGRLYLQSGGYDSVHRLDPYDGPDYLAYSNLDFGLRYVFRPTDFTQVNPYINRSLVRSAVMALDPSPGATAADLFCGIGNFALALARLGVNVQGYENASASIERARLNASLNGLSDGAQFRVVDLYHAEGEALPAADFLLLDPPRSGAGPNLRRWASWQQLERIVYVSCNPDTFAEDAWLLQQMGFNLKEVGIYDMFPHTAHVETLGVFQRRG